MQAYTRHSLRRGQLYSLADSFITKNYFKNYGDLSNVGQARPGLTSKALRLGLSPRMIAGASRFLGLPGLALTTGLAGYNAYKNYQNEEGMIYNFFNNDE